MISIIIPVYNADIDMLRECINSVISQKVLFELIIIDDGSESVIADFLDTIGYSDKRIKVIHKANEGVSVARNIGIENATGQWIMFIDADDWIEPESLTILCRKCEESDSDMIFTGHKRNYPKREIEIKCATYRDGQIIDGDSEKIRLLQKTIAGSEYGEVGARATCFRAVWSVLFRKSLLVDNHIRFPNGIQIGEDLIFRLNSEYASKSIQYIDYSYYHYRNNKSSASVRYRKDAVRDSLNELQQIRRFIEINNLWYYLDEAYRFRIIEIMTVLPRRCFFNDDNPDNNKKRCKDATEFYTSSIIKENINSAILTKLPIKRRVQVFLLSHRMYGIYMQIYKSYTFKNR